MKIRFVIAFVIAAACLASGIFNPSVLAQSGKEPTDFKDVTIWVNPEYDDPRLFVMLEGKIGGVTVPALVRFLVPAAAEKLEAVSKDAQGRYFGGPPNRKASEVPGWDEISYEVQTDIFHVEYYDPVISSHADKRISYDFLRVYPISNLTVFVQEPRASSNFTAVPPGVIGRDDEGFVIHRYNFSNLEVSTPVHFDIAYTKSDPAPSLKSPKLINTSGAGANAGSPNWGLLLGIVGGVTVIGGLFIWRQRAGKARYTSRQVARSQQRRAAKREAPKNKFCTECGRPIEGQSRFCPHCGAKLSNPAS